MKKNLAIGLALVALVTAVSTIGCASSMDEPLRNDDETSAKEAYARSEAMKNGADTTKTQSSCWVGWDTCCYGGYCCTWWLGSATCGYHVP